MDLKIEDVSYTRVHTRVWECVVTSSGPGEQFCLLALLRADLTLALAGWPG